MTGKKILVIEDDRVTVARLEDLLSEWGYTVLTAATVEAAVELALAERPILVLMDTRLESDTDGTQETRLRQHLDLPTIYLTTPDEEKHLQQVTPEKPFSYIVKPVQPIELLAAIQCALYIHTLEAERDQTTKSLQESEKQLRLITNNILDLITLTDSAGVIQYASPAKWNVLGVPTGQLVGKSIFDGMHPEDIERVVQVINQTMITGSMGQAEVRYRHADGHYVWLETSGKPLFDDTGAIVGGIFSSRDITARKHAEEQLRQYASEQAALYAVSSAATAFLEPDVLLSKIIDVITTIPGVQADGAWVLTLDNDRAEFSTLGPVRGVSIEPLEAGSTVAFYNCPVCIANAELTPHDALLHFAPHVLANAGIQSHICLPLSTGGRVLGSLTLGWQSQHTCSATDLSLLMSIGRQVGLALRNAQLYQSAIQVNRLEAINEISTVAGSSLELDVVLQQVLEKACQTLDAESGAILLGTPDTKDLAFACISPGMTGIRSDQRVPAELGIIGWVIQYRQVARINDIKRDPQIYRGLEPIFGPGIESLICAHLIHRDKPTGVIVIFNKHHGEFSQEDADLLESVSSIVASALDNARLYEDLKQSLLEKERTQAQLIQNEKIAALGRLAASVAHEINNPLQAIQGCLSLLADELADSRRPDKMNSYLSIVDNEIGRIADIVQRMRDYARPVLSGTQRIDVIAVLEDVLELAGKQLQYSGIHVERAWGVEIPTIQANPNLLKQVILNMILNAIDAMPEGGTLQISANAARIKTSGRSRTQPAVQLKFSDSGQGMPPETIARLFEPFFTTKEHGSGLGLHISYTIIQSLNGKIEVSSAVGRGTTFTISLPVKPKKITRGEQP
jgi:PAS domain S-box-containing protein